MKTVKNCALIGLISTIFYLAFAHIEKRDFSNIPNIPQDLVKKINKQFAKPVAYLRTISFSGGINELTYKWYDGSNPVGPIIRSNITKPQQLFTISKENFYWPSVKFGNFKTPIEKATPPITVSTLSFSAYKNSERIPMDELKIQEKVWKSLRHNCPGGMDYPVIGCIRPSAEEVQITSRSADLALAKDIYFYENVLLNNLEVVTGKKNWHLFYYCVNISVDLLQNIIKIDSLDLVGWDATNGSFLGQCDVTAWWNKNKTKKTFADVTCKNLRSNFDIITIPGKKFDQLAQANTTPVIIDYADSAGTTGTDANAPGSTSCAQ